MRHVIVVGGTGGIGRAVAAAYLQREWRVGIMGRDAAKVRSVAADLRSEYPAGTVVEGVLDLSEGGDPRPTMEAVLAELGQLDHLVYCAGVLAGEDRLDDMVEVNLTAAMRVLRWGADYLSQSGSGRLAGVGSVAGDRGRKGNPAYGATKAGLHAYLEGVRHELHPHGVGVSTIKPGWIRTSMLGSVPGFPPAISAEAAAERIVSGLEKGRDVFYVPGWWWLISAVLRALPSALFKRIAPP